MVFWDTLYALSVDTDRPSSCMRTCASHELTIRDYIAALALVCTTIMSSTAKPELAAVQHLRLGL